MSDLRVALIGAGHIAGVHLRAWRSVPRCRVTGLHDALPEQAELRRRQFRLPSTFPDLGAAIESADVIDVCTPPGTHADIVAQVCSAGRHLLVEKPIVATLGEWERLLPLLQHSTGRVAVVHHLKFSSAMLRVSRWVGGGVIGRLLRFDHKFLTSPATDRMLSRPHWSHTLPGRRWFETLPHALYVLHALVGPLALEHVAVIASTGAPAGAPADEVTVTLAGASTLATLHYSAHCPENRRTIVLAGGNGFIEWDLLSGSARLAHAPDSAWRRALGPILTQAPRDLLAAVPERASAAAHRLLGRTPHARLIHSFARHVTDGGPEPTPLAEVDYVVRTCDAIGHMIERRIQGQAGSPRYLA